MGHPEGVSQWAEELAKALPVLSVAQRRVLAQWCFAMEQTGLCATHTLAVFLGLALGCAWGTARQRLREWYWDAEDKQGLDRREVDVRACFAPLARWVLAHWPGTPGIRVRVAIALDATSLGDRLTILAVSIVYKGCAVPVAWKILPAARKRAWNPEWVALLGLVAPAFPRDWQVIVLTDRGLYSRVLYRAIVGHGWHPFMRVNIRGTFHPAGGDRRQPMAAFTPRVGTGWAGAGVAFADPDARLRCTLLACWEPGYKDPWCILTDLHPSACSVAWYGLRNWIEIRQPQHPHTRDSPRASSGAPLDVALLGEGDVAMGPAARPSRSRRCRRAVRVAAAAARASALPVQSALVVADPVVGGHDGARAEPHHLEVPVARGLAQRGDAAVARVAGGVLQGDQNRPRSAVSAWCPPDVGAGPGAGPRVPV